MTFLTRLAAPLALVATLAACQSSRPAFVFAPAPAYLGSSRLAAAVAGPAPVAAPAARAAAAGLSAAAPHPVAVPARRQPAHQLAPQPVAPAQLPAAGPGRRRALAAVLRPRQHPRATARVAENGLGNIALFALVVVLGLLAGLGALVALIPGVSFWGGVGLAAAGLLVIFLLYSLLSGKGKKAKAKTK